MTDQPDISTLIRTRRGWTGLFYQGMPVKFIDWLPTRDGRHLTVTTDNREHWLLPETQLEDMSNVRTPDP
jgi:hypothetical protein